MKIILEEDISNNECPKDECPKELEQKFLKYGAEKVKNINDITDDDKGQWINHTAMELHEQFKSLMKYTGDEVEIDNTDWSALNYEPYGEDYYRDKFPGFDDEIYTILAESSKAENTLLDERIPPLKITQVEHRPFKKD